MRQMRRILLIMVGGAGFELERGKIVGPIPPTVVLLVPISSDGEVSR